MYLSKKFPYFLLVILYLRDESFSILSRIKCCRYLRDFNRIITLHIRICLMFHTGRSSIKITTGNFRRAALFALLVRSLNIISRYKYKVDKDQNWTRIILNI